MLTRIRKERDLTGLWLSKFFDGSPPTLIKVLSLINQDMVITFLFAFDKCFFQKTRHRLVIKLCLLINIRGPRDVLIFMSFVSILTEFMKGFENDGALTVTLAELLTGT